MYLISTKIATISTWCCLHVVYIVHAGYQTFTVRLMYTHLKMTAHVLLQTISWAQVNICVIGSTFQTRLLEWRNFLALQHSSSNSRSTSSISFKTLHEIQCCIEGSLFWWVKCRSYETIRHSNVRMFDRNQHVYVYDNTTLLLRTV